VTVIQGTLLVADHAHGGAALTATVPVPASFVNVVRSGETAYSQGAAAPSCVTATDDPATVNVPVRALLPAFAAALNVTTAVPEPLEPAVIVSQLD